MTVIITPFVSCWMQEFRVLRKYAGIRWVSWQIRRRRPNKLPDLCAAPRSARLQLQLTEPSGRDLWWQWTSNSSKAGQRMYVALALALLGFTCKFAVQWEFANQCSEPEITVWTVWYRFNYSLLHNKIYDTTVGPKNWKWNNKWHKNSI